MSLFQKSVLNKYLKNQDQDKIKEAYQQFTAYFHNPTIQENIRNAKEEQFQEGFLRELFVKVLGYTLNPEPDFNLTTEFKNQKGAKKADGAILKDGKALGVIELKGTDTQDLAKINDQAFGYKNNHSGCIYVVTSNFEKLRFFIHNAVEHIEFNLFTLSADDFAVLWLCLHSANIMGGVPLLANEDSILIEENVTKKLYKDYSTFKHELWQNLCELNPDFDQLLLFKKSQKLLDRFLFVFFAEDSGLLPPNSVSKIITKWNEDSDWGDDKSLYDIYKQYFGFINKGRPAKGKREEIFAYNGGLFLPDEILDNITIADEILAIHTAKLSAYDFQSEVDVNILGHIFENSLNEIENVTAQLQGLEVDKSKTKRKKDGVFYTPKYITKYIVENTVGKLCEEKKAELGVIDEEYAKGRKKRKKDTIKKLDTALKQYRDWLLNITICDPACGSGAFLNQALEYLINEHAYIDGLNAQLFGASIVFQDVSNHVLENNIFGVDINEESVEIAKLSLWLRTAQRGRKLTTLNNNIKCGNSLIDEPTIAGEKAFNWQNEFPDVFKNGGFDVVVGNPPYVSSKEENFSDVVKAFLTNNYNTAIYQIDLYILFLEKSISLHNSKGICSFIVPNAWLNNLFLKDVRTYMLKNTFFYEIVSMPPNTFADANVDTIIVSIGSKRELQTKLVSCKNSDFFELGKVSQNQWLNDENNIINVYATNEVTSILEKIKSQSVTLSSFTEIARGVGVYHKRVGHTKELIAKDPYQSKTKKDDTFVAYLRGKNVNPWSINWNNDSYISYGNWLAEPREPKYFEGERIVLRQIPSSRLIATYINKKFITDQSVFIARFLNNSNEFEPKSILSLITSKLFSFYFRFYYSEFDDLFPKVKLQHFKDLPIHISMNGNAKNKFNQSAAKRLELSNSFNNLQSKFAKHFKMFFQLDQLNKKLQSWHELDFKAFLSELEKARKKVAKDNGQDYKKLSLADQAEWMEYFNEQKEQAQSLQAEINQTDKEIDSMVYELYGLTEEEIQIVESGV
mgnify:CR=1 FL=1